MDSQKPSMATPRIAAGALFFDDEGSVPLAKPAYKNGWDIPGGYVEPGESPRAACIREVREELGLSIDPQELLVVDWAPAEGEGDKLLFIFDGGTLSQETSNSIRFQDEELIDLRFTPDQQMEAYLSDRLQRRIRTAIGARKRGSSAYAEHGEEA